jgi:DNA-binding Lrp family transcriptional regulator
MSVKDSLDKIDYEIIHMLQQDPTLTHSTIAKKLDRSQPAIGARIKRLTEIGILATQIGVDFKKVQDFFLARTDMVCNKPDEVMELAEFCPYVVNVMKMSGEYNISVLLAAGDIRRLDKVIDRHYRNKSYISKVCLERITDMARSLILPIELRPEIHHCEGKDPCDQDPICRAAREKAKVKSPEQILAALDNPSINITQ